MSLATGEGTVAYSINLSRAVTGAFYDANSATHGFTRSARGVITTFDAPNAGTGPSEGTRPSTNNSEGDVTGWYIDASDVSHGFVRKTARDD